MAWQFDLLCDDLLRRVIADSARLNIPINDVIMNNIDEYADELNTLFESADPDDKVPFTIVEMFIIMALAIK